MSGLHPCTLPQQALFTAVRHVSPLCAAFCPACECVRGTTGKANVAPPCAKNTRSRSSNAIAILSGGAGAHNPERLCDRLLSRKTDCDSGRAKGSPAAAESHRQQSQPAGGVGEYGQGTVRHPEFCRVNSRQERHINIYDRNTSSTRYKRAIEYKSARRVLCQ